MPPELSDSDRTEVENELFAGRKIQAIKRLRGATGLGLKEAKDIVDAMEKDLRGSTPEKFTAPAKTGCASIIVLVLGTSLSILAALLRY